MSFAAEGLGFDQFVNEHVHQLSFELSSVGSEIDAAIEEGKIPSQENIDMMFLIIDKMKAQGKFILQIANGVEEMLKRVLDEGTGALSASEPDDHHEEEEDEVSSELIDLSRHTRDVITILESNGIDEEIIDNATSFAEYIEMLV